jgi:hypothetical protein
MFLEYRDPIGMTKEIPIVAARTVESENGEMLVLWVRRDPEEVEDEGFDIDLDDDSGLDW